ncbi:hypothetical protein EDB81DRAFT_947674 [Dactylonectria macrodidyma]|uniref:Uncharacterized protein n=1 Tax=Dactylonectria macrodidyma TaxID=307937 RepID=A0A9P9ES35_9HYPO|nr:hypothetical protein EDB81DRAFT_947674 [Dactylonectria macrodidyma]
MRTASLLSVLSAVGAAVASPARRAVSDSPFSLYAYGTGLSGLRLFTSGDEAYVGNYALVDDSEAAPVIFTKQSDDSLLGSPDTSLTSTASWSNLTFYVPSPSSSEHAVGFVESADSVSDIVTEFTFYGSWIATEDDSGTLQMLWYVTPTDTTGIYSLKWNTTGDSTDGKISIALRTTAPSS